jgi:hypothetical protein
MHAILYPRLRLSKEQEGLIYRRFFPATFNVQSDLRDERSLFESRGRHAIPRDREAFQQELATSGAKAALIVFLTSSTIS